MDDKVYTSLFTHLRALDEGLRPDELPMLNSADIERLELSLRHLADVARAELRHRLYPAVNRSYHD